MAALDSFALILQAAVKAAQDHLTRCDAARFAQPQPCGSSDAERYLGLCDLSVELATAGAFRPARLSIPLLSLLHPSALRIKILTLDLPVLVEEVSDPTAPGGVGLALRVGRDAPKGARHCRLTLECAADDYATVEVKVDGHRIATFRDQRHDPE